MGPSSSAGLPVGMKDCGRKSAMLIKTVCLLLIIQNRSCLTQLPRGSQSDPMSVSAGALLSTSNRSQVASRGPSGFSGSKIEVRLEAVASDPIDHPPVTRVANSARPRRLAGPFNFLPPPKLVQWSKEPVQYYEGSTLVLSCSLSQSGGEQPQLKFIWFRNGKPIGSNAQQRLSIETLADYSFLRLADLRPTDSGSYTCVASNSLGQEDRTTTQVIVNVKLKWIGNSNALPDELHVNRTLLDGETGHQLVKSRAGQAVVFECNVSGGQRPQVRWFKLVAPGGKARVSQSPLTKYRFEQGLLDEMQLKMTLSQLDTIQSDTQMQRHELNNDGLVDKSSQLFNDTSGKQFRWRVEANAAPSNKQTQELFSRLILDRVEPNYSGIYGCDAGSTSSAQEQHLSNDAQRMFVGQETSSVSINRRTQSGDKLHRFFGLVVNGK